MKKKNSDSLGETNWSGGFPDIEMESEGKT